MTAVQRNTREGREPCTTQGPSCDNVADQGVGVDLCAVESARWRCPVNGCQTRHRGRVGTESYRLRARPGNVRGVIGQDWTVQSNGPYKARGAPVTIAQYRSPNDQCHHSVG